VVCLNTFEVCFYGKETWAYRMRATDSIGARGREWVA